MKIRIASILLCLVMAISIMSGCGTTQSVETATDESTANEQTAKMDDTQKDSSDADSSKSTEKKKIAIVQELDDDIRNVAEKNIIGALEKGGFVNGSNAEITEYKLAGDEKKSPEIVEKIKELNPDVVILNAGSFAFKSIAQQLAGTTIPVVISSNVDNSAYGFIDANGKPKQNVTGLYTYPKDLQVNAFKLLQSIYPADGKKAVFITVDGRFKKEDVEKNLKEVGVELKDFCESKYLEDFQAAVEKYNNDPEVGWMLIGVWPVSKKDGTTVAVTETAKWDIENRKKPSTTYYEVAVNFGMLCGLGIDLGEAATQTAEIAVNILNGVKVDTINAVYPRKTSIVLNQKSAQNMNIQIPAEILGTASKVYTTTVNDPK